LISVFFMNARSNWCVITGGPSSGKKTVLRLIRKKGFQVFPQVARGVIDKEMGKGKSLKEIRKNETAFQLSLLPLKLKFEQRLPKNQCLFLNLALPDSVAYIRACGGDFRKALKLCKRSLYRRVFFLEQLPKMTKDYARTEDIGIALKLGRLIKETYRALGYRVISVPVMSPNERARFILSFI
jgi:predicted ATPase